jgi:hypothetical protein
MNLSNTVFVIRGEVNGSMAYVTKRENGIYTAAPSTRGVYGATLPSTRGVYGATLFAHRGDAKNALDTMPHGDAILMEIVELEPK